MDAQGSQRVHWGGWVWLVALIAVLLAILILAVIWPRFAAWTAPEPTSVPWTQAPGLYQIPTVTPAAPPPTTAPAP